MKRSILPDRRLRLRVSDHGKALLPIAILVVLGAGLLLGASWFVSSAGTIGRDKDIWACGIAASNGTVKGKRTSKIGLAWLLANYDANVSYTDAEGARYEGDFSFWTMVGGPDTNRAELRYDPNHHDRFSVNWAVDASGARWRAVLLMTTLLGLVGVVLLGGAWLVIHGQRARARVAATGDEIELRVLSSSPVLDANGRFTGRSRYQLALDDGTTTHTLARELRTQPLYCAPNDALVVGLWSPGTPRHVLIVEHDLSPLAVTDDERNASQTRAAKAVAAELQ